MEKFKAVHPILPVQERNMLIGFLLRQFFDITFRQTQGLMECFNDYFEFQKIPSHILLSKKNQSKRWHHLWKRFHRFIVDGLSHRKAILSSGFSGRRRTWKETPHAIRAVEDWVKVHAAIETDDFFVLNYELTKSNVHDSQMFGDIWDDIPNNIMPNAVSA